MEKKEGKKGLRPKLYSYIHDNDKKDKNTKGIVIYYKKRN